MNDFISSVSSPGWWLSVVIVGILINLTSAYLKPRLDGWLCVSSRRWATRTEDRRRLREARIQKLRESQHEQLMAASEVLDWRLRSVAVMLGAALLMALVVTIEVMGTSHYKLLLIPIVAAAICTLLALECHRIAAREQMELWEARRNEDTVGKKVECA